MFTRTQATWKQFDRIRIKSVEASSLLQVWGFSRLPHTEADVGAGRGGMCLFINPSIKHLIHSQGSIGENQAQWVRFSENQGRDLAVLNVYAPNTLQERIHLWQELRRGLPNDCQWVACGDWNIVEDAEDKSIRSGRILIGVELLEFNSFKAQLSLYNFFSRQSAIRFLWDNLQRDGEKVLVRLDRVYSFAFAQG